MPKKVIIIQPDDPLPQLRTPEHDTSLVQYNYDSTGLDWAGSGDFVLWALHFLVLMALLILLILLIRNTVLVGKANRHLLESIKNPESMDSSFRATLSQMIEDEVLKRFRGGV